MTDNVTDSENLVDSAKAQPLCASELRPHCDPVSLGFSTSDELSGIDLPIGQSRALDAIKFGTSIDRPGYNLFALGAPRTGRHDAVTSIVEARAKQADAPDDWVYVHNFSSSYKPKAMCLPAGVARPFADAMAELVNDLCGVIPATFQSDDYRDKRRAIDEEFEKLQEQGFEKIKLDAEANDSTIMRTPMGFSFAPVIDGKVATPEAFGKLPEEKQMSIEQAHERLKAELAEFLGQLPDLQKRHRDRIKALDAEFTASVVDATLKVVSNQFSEVQPIQNHLAEVRNDLIDNTALFTTNKAELPELALLQPPSAQSDDSRFNRYLVNVMVENDNDGDHKGAPVITEDHPTLANIVGRIEHTAQYGALTTDFTMIRPGALHRANGGFLVLDARKLLTEMFSWEALKRALRAHSISIVAVADQLSLVSTVSLQPEPIPLRVKVVLVGDSMLYYLLSGLDPDFAELFKVEADFDHEFPRNDENISLYARLIASILQKQELLPMEAAAVACVIDEITRLAQDSERLSLQTGALTDLLYESDYWAAEESAAVIGMHHVQKALAKQRQRADRVRTLSHDMIQRDTVLIQTEGTAVGQINGLSVLSLGKNSFGQPSRITVRTRVGSGDVVDIEREAKLGGPLHSKGVLILSGYLAATYTPHTPMSLWASIVFEQSYGGVDGDSASSAELYALLSALAEVPIKQSLACTGSVNQFGRVQAIGGVNQKIEGYFDICKSRGLNGNQGVLIPDSNVKHLVLRQDVVDAVADGQFYIYPIKTINQGIELLTGITAGTRQQDGHFPPQSVNALVEEKLYQFAQVRRDFSGKNKDSGTSKTDKHTEGTPGNNQPVDKIGTDCHYDENSHYDEKRSKVLTEFPL